MEVDFWGSPVDKVLSVSCCDPKRLDFAAVELTVFILTRLSLSFAPWSVD